MKKINKKKQLIYTYIEENIKVLMKKLNLKNKNEILRIRWTSVDSKKYTVITRYKRNNYNFINIYYRSCFWHFINK